MSAKYTQGSILKHMVVMGGAAMLGLVSLFLVDLVDMYFLSLLGEIELAAAVGYAGTILFFTTSVGIGLAIACSAQVSKAIGEDNDLMVKQKMVNGLTISFLISLPITLLMYMMIPSLLSLIGAEGRTLDLSVQYLQIIVPSMPILSVGMCLGGVLRAQGDAKGAMYVILVGGIVNAILDPFLIFTLEMGIQGAAVASVLGRVAIVVYGIKKLFFDNDLFVAPKLVSLKEDIIPYSVIAFPAILTNVATPIGSSILMIFLSPYGDSAVAGFAIINRIIPVAFVFLFSLSGAVGPIIGQNYGAKLYPRMIQVLVDSTKLVTGYVLLVSFGLWLSTSLIIDIFKMSPEASELIILFCGGVSLSFIFHGISFSTNAILNNIGHPFISTILNFSKATIFTIPFLWGGAQIAGASGIIIGQGIGAIFAGVIGWIWTYIMIAKKRNLPDTANIS
jgi:putative MATE family efflux protein